MVERQTTLHVSKSERADDLTCVCTWSWLYGGAQGGGVKIKKQNGDHFMVERKGMKV